MKYEKSYFDTYQEIPRLPSRPIDPERSESGDVVLGVTLKSSQISLI